ncbi:MAG: hypothetical protein AB1324_06230 [Candidatus Micrarchaeota archaeon]
MKNDHTLKAAAGTVLLVLLAVGMFLVADALAPFRKMPPPPPENESAPQFFVIVRGDTDNVMPSFFLVHTFLSISMLGFSLYLLFIYLKDYLQLKSRFTLGILVAIFSFMLFAITANPLLMVFLGVYGGRGVFSLIPYVFATLALAMLVWVSSK